MPWAFGYLMSKLSNRIIVVKFVMDVHIMLIQCIKTVKLFNFCMFAVVLDRKI